jgi:hypothetical protein
VEAGEDSSCRYGAEKNRNQFKKLRMRKAKRFNRDDR